MPEGAAKRELKVHPVMDLGGATLREIPTLPLENSYVPVAMSTRFWKLCSQ